MSIAKTMPGSPIIEKTLRRIVRNALKNEEEITVKSARARAEEELVLDTDFFKSSEEWKDRSKSIITDAVNEEPETEEVTPKAQQKAPAKTSKKRKSEEVEEAPKAKPKKRVKKSPVVEPSSDGDEVIDSEDDLSEPEAESRADSASADKQSKVTPVEDSGNESELSVLIDEPPAKKKRQWKSSSPGAKSKKSSTAAKPSTKAKAPTKEVSADDEEIKRLQGWLVKCGVRKLWHNELKSCDTAKAKIKHLKAMLADVGMTGRYNAEKAREIKEARELKEEIEAAKEFNDQWGKEGKGVDAESDEEDEKVEVKRRPAGRVLPKGLVDFGDSGDSE